MGCLLPHPIAFTVQVSDSPERCCDNSLANHNQPINSSSKPNDEGHHRQIGRECAAQDKQGDDEHDDEGANSAKDAGKCIAHGCDCVRNFRERTGNTPAILDLFKSLGSYVATKGCLGRDHCVIAEVFHLDQRIQLTHAFAAGIDVDQVVDDPLTWRGKDTANNATCIGPSSPFGVVTAGLSTQGACPGRGFLLSLVRRH